MCGALITATRRYRHVPRAAMIAAESAAMLPARIPSRHRSRPAISRRKPALAATRRPRRLRLSAVARPADSATGRSPTLADRRVPTTPPQSPPIANLYPPNDYPCRALRVPPHQRLDNDNFNHGEFTSGERGNSEHDSGWPSNAFPLRTASPRAGLGDISTERLAYPRAPQLRHPPPAPRPATPPNWPNASSPSTANRWLLKIDSLTATLRCSPSRSRSGSSYFHAVDQSPTPRLLYAPLPAQCSQHPEFRPVARELQACRKDTMNRSTFLP
jgi:hypothetical protein